MSEQEEPTAKGMAATAETLMALAKQRRTASRPANILTADQLVLGPETGPDPDPLGPPVTPLRIHPRAPTDPEGVDHNPFSDYGHPLSSTELGFPLRPSQTAAIMQLLTTDPTETTIAAPNPPPEHPVLPKVNIRNYARKVTLNCRKQMYVKEATRLADKMFEKELGVSTKLKRDANIRKQVIDLCSREITQHKGVLKSRLLPNGPNAQVSHLQLRRLTSIIYGMQEKDVREDQQTRVAVLRALTNAMSHADRAGKRYWGKITMELTGYVGMPVDLYNAQRLLHQTYTDDLKEYHDMDLPAGVDPILPCDSEDNVTSYQLVGRGVDEDDEA
ncbi:hypothetical protein DFS34DRAFT_668377 [Phlyctochytrium arcticum]|nr:hypothetical protein DFS34DRAFT_668377 [Phlyctochytrium arcticum]